MNYGSSWGGVGRGAASRCPAGERPDAAVAVVNEAMVVRAHDRVRETNDPTAHAVVVALREAARKLGTARLADATIFATREPCTMCVGALLESDVEALVYAVANDQDGAAGTIVQLAQHPGAAASDQGGQRDPPRRSTRLVRAASGSLSGARVGRTAGDGGFGILSRGEVSEWLMVPLSKSGVRKHRGSESRPLRHLSPPERTMAALSPALFAHALLVRSLRARLRLPMAAHAAEGRGTNRKCLHRLSSASWRGRLVDYGAALEMRFGETRRGFESRPLRHTLFT